MRISKHAHSCLLIEDGATRVLVDPGRWTTAPESFTNIAAIFITHNHGDHADPSVLKTVLSNNPSAVVYGNADTQSLLAKENIAVELFESGAKHVGDMAIEAQPADHEPLLSMTPPKNTAYLFNKELLAVGDSIAKNLVELKSVPVLASAVMAPWATGIQLGTFMSDMAPKYVIPMHDAFAVEGFRKSQYGMFQNHLAANGIDFRPLENGEALEA